MRCQGNSGNLSANMIYLQLFTRATSQSPCLHENLATAAIKRFGRILPNKLFLWFVAFFHKGSLACRQFHPGRAVAAGDKEENGYCFNPETTIGIVFGELTAPYQSERVQAIEDLFADTGLHYRATEYIKEEMWCKFRLNVSNNLPQAVLGAGVGCYRDSTHMKEISNKLREELEAIAAAKGIDIRKADDSSSHGSAVPPSARYSTLQDLDAGRHTEIDMFSGVLIRMGKELGIPTPYNEYTYHIIKALEEKNDGKFDYQKDDESVTCSR